MKFGDQWSEVLAGNMRLATHHAIGEPGQPVRNQARGIERLARGVAALYADEGLTDYGCANAFLNAPQGALQKHSLVGDGAKLFAGELRDGAQQSLRASPGVVTARNASTVDDRTASGCPPRRKA